MIQLIISIFCLMCILELVNIVIFGFLTKKSIIQDIWTTDTSKLRLSDISKSIVLNDTELIAKMPFGITCKYYYQNYYADKKGMIGRWTKLHKQINKYKKIAKENTK